MQLAPCVAEQTHDSTHKGNSKLGKKRGKIRRSTVACGSTKTSV